MGKNSNHLDNKGISCDAIGLGDDRFVMCGESGKYAERSSGGTQKDGFVAFGKFGSENFEAYAMGMACMILGGKKWSYPEVI
ncbi:MAG: hypothetical protein IPO72_01750 [Saprospiraceae bacterium]|nr:hypothetical protein [Candidatus Vicinibacter affinis]